MLIVNYRGCEGSDGKENWEQATVDEATNEMARCSRAREAKKERRCTKVNNKCNYKAIGIGNRTDTQNQYRRCLIKDPWALEGTE